MRRGVALVWWRAEIAPVALGPNLGVPRATARGKPSIGQGHRSALGHGGRVRGCWDQQDAPAGTSNQDIAWAFGGGLTS